jgi:hypothetical protein
MLGMLEQRQQGMTGSLSLPMLDSDRKRLAAPSFVTMDQLPTPGRKSCPKFSAAVASESMLSSLRPQGPPAQIGWDPAKLVTHPASPFRVKINQQPSITEEPWRPGDCRKGAHRARRNSLASPNINMKCSAPPGVYIPPTDDMEELERPHKFRANAQQYYELLMKSHNSARKKN